VQHVSLHPPGLVDCPYNYADAHEVIAAMQRHGVGLSLCGHFHDGLDATGPQGIRFVGAPALYHAPFEFLTIDVHDGGREVSVRRRRLALPEGSGLVDVHVHTPLAYCSGHIPTARAVEVGAAIRLDGLGFSEHSDQLYFDEGEHGGDDCLERGVAAIRPEADRVEQYARLMRDAGVPRADVGMEVECDFRGRAILRREHRELLGFLMGAIHQTPSLRREGGRFEAACEEYLAQLRTFAGTGIHVLAHPFRAFRRCGLPRPRRLYQPVADLLAEHDIAAEINCRSNEPDEEFFGLCIERGVRLTLGSDSHNLHEIGEFTPHLALLDRLGVADPRDVLTDPRGSNDMRSRSAP
jgi:histidinol phosphatase-like PHP family hydrolase